MQKSLAHQQYTNRPLKHLDLFSGIGGFSLGLEATGEFETVAFCDIDPYCRKVLHKHWPHVKQFEDIKELNYDTLKANGIDHIDIITGGYPCQPFSVAGRKKGEEDPRHLWPEYFRLVKELRPTWVIGENVSGHIKLGLDTVLEDLESEGYSARTFSISASSIGANHQRERVWIVANSRQHGRGIEPTWNTESVGRGTSEETEWSTNTSTPSRSSEGTETMANTESFFSNGRRDNEHTEERNTERKIGRESSNVANTEREGLQRSEQYETHTGKTETQFAASQSFKTAGDHWAVEPNVGRVAHGVPKRVDRLKSLGNSLVPHIPYFIGCVIIECLDAIEKGDYNA